MVTEALAVSPESAIKAAAVLWRAAAAIHLVESRVVAGWMAEVIHLVEPGAVATWTAVETRPVESRAVVVLARATASQGVIDVIEVTMAVFLMVLFQRRPRTTLSNDEARRRGARRNHRVTTNLDRASRYNCSRMHACIQD